MSNPNDADLRPPGGQGWISLSEGADTREVYVDEFNTVNPVYTVTHGPTIESIAPDHGPAGTPVTIQATNVQPMAVVEIGGEPLRQQVIREGGVITGVVPTVAAGAQDVVLTNPHLPTLGGRTATLEDGFTVE